MLDIKPWLETTGLKVAEEKFKKPPLLPYVIFTESNDIRGADTKNCISERVIGIELYSENIDRVSEGKIDDLLNEKLIEYSKERIWIDSQLMFETIYVFNLIEKY